MTPTKLTHEELCELWAKARTAKIHECTWLMDTYILAQKWLPISVREKIGVFGSEMENRYGQDED